MKRIYYLLLALVPPLLVPWLGWSWLIFTVYLLILYFEEPLGRRYAKIGVDSRVKYFLVFLATGLLLELFAIIDNLPRPPAERILLSPDPIYDLYLSIGYYSGFALVWSVVATRIKFTHRDVFLIGGAFGLLFEQTGHLLLSLQVLAWPYVFVVYGSFQAIPAVLAGYEHVERKEIGLPKKIGVGIATEVACFLTAFVFLWILKAI